MSEYIELINKLREQAEWEAYLEPNSGYETPKLLSKAADVIEKLSKERKKGEWIETFSHGWASGWKCSECVEYSPCRYNFCPNCGADMRGVDNG